jgi:predicted nucleotidyltransferase
LNPDFRDILLALNDEGAEFLIVGAFAVAHYGISRSTGDIDIFIRPAPENARKVWRALLRFGAPLSGLTVEELSRPNLIFVMGREPQRIDLMTEIDGLDFDAASQHSTEMPLDGRKVPVIGIRELLTNKRATNRPKDKYDILWLEWKLKGLEGQ